MWDYVDKRVKFVSIYELNQEHNVHTKGTKFVRFCSWTLESCLLILLPIIFCFILNNIRLASELL